MNVWIDCYAPLIGRIFMGGFFLWNGIQAALNLPAAADVFTLNGIENGLYWAALAVAIKILGGVALVMGQWTRWAALCLAGYLLLQSALLTDFGSDAGLNLFVLNLGLIGGLLFMASYKNRPSY